MNEIKLGQEYKDLITGFKGVCTGITTYISGCTQALICPRCKKDSKSEAEWLDIQRLQSTGKKIIELDNVKTPGFDKAAPKR
jgi:hypothetical protein